MSIHMIQFGATNVNITDDVSLTITDNVGNIPNVQVFLGIACQRQLNGTLNYPGALFHVQYNRPPIIISDQGGNFANTDTDDKFCLITSGASTSFKNRGGTDTDANLFCFNFFHLQGV